MFAALGVATVPYGMAVVEVTAGRSGRRGGCAQIGSTTPHVAVAVAEP